MSARPHVRSILSMAAVLVAAVPGFLVGVATSAQAADPVTFFGTEVPVVRTDPDPTPVEVGTRLTATSAGQITAIRFYKGGSVNGGRHVGSIWSSTGERLRRVVFTGETASGWQRMRLGTPLPVTEGQSFVVSYYAPQGRYSATRDYFTTSITRGPLRAPANAGVYREGLGGGFPTQTYAASAYFVDAVFTPKVVEPTPTPPPPVTTTWPSGTTTGVPAGTVLRSSGPLTITTANTVIDGLLVNGSITVRAPGVVIRNTRIVGGVIDNGDNPTSTYNTLIQDVEIDGRGLADAGRRAGIGYSGFTAVRVNIHHVGVGVNANGNNVVRDSWIHDLVVTGDPASGGSHNEPILSNGGANMTFVGNRLDAGTEPNFSGALCLYGDFAQIRNVLVQGNLFNGGGYAVYAGSVSSKPFPYAANTRFIDNVFGTAVWPKSGYWGPATAYRSGNGNEWTGNVMNGQLVQPGSM